MAHLVWTEELDIGIDTIDVQHRRIVQLINQLEDVLAGDLTIELKTIVNGLVDYTVSHFSYEEALMEEAGYEFLRAHKRVHELFIKRVSEFKTRIDDGEPAAEELHKLLAGWLFSHIRGDDSSYVKCVKDHLLPMNSAVFEEKQTSWLARFFGRA